MPTLRDEYDRLHRESDRLAGALLDIPRRAVILQHMFLDSGGNHAFPLVAAHGALWAYSYFETGGSLGRFIAKRYFYNPKERAFRLELLRGFAERFRQINRKVCVDTYANYQFTKVFGREKGADEVVDATLLEGLNEVHDAATRKELLPAADRRRVFELSFRCEQEITVAPGVKDAVNSFECRIMKFILLHPVVRFAYFPSFRYLMFRNFASTDERITKGLRTYDYAERVGWQAVREAALLYGVVEPRFVTAPEEMFAELGTGG